MSSSRQLIMSQPLLPNTFIYLTLTLHERVAICQQFGNVFSLFAVTFTKKSCSFLCLALFSSTI